MKRNHSAKQQAADVAATKRVAIAALRAAAATV
jgi:hypothetical protein